jgi:inosose dehydratase
MKDFLGRIAGAPITWGVDGSPGWGYLMKGDRVMTEMAETGLSATELGPDGFLPTDPDQLKSYLSGYGLQLVGGFVPALLYRPDRIEAELAYVERASRQLGAGGSKVLVVGPSSNLDGYDRSVEMTDEEGLAAAVHPHWGMAIERPHHIERLLDSCDVGICLDTGHIYLGGGDPVEIARMAPDRVIHVHLKDVDPAAAEAVRSGALPFRRGVIEGMFVPLGQGAVDVAGVISVLEDRGYQGWYVIEQDKSLADEPSAGEGPMTDAKTSVAYLRRLANGH